jgi:hypothetical protein
MKPNRLHDAVARIGKRQWGLFVSSPRQFWFLLLSIAVVFLTALPIASPAQALSGSAANYITGLFQQQIITSSSASTVNGVTLYEPVLTSTGNTIVPQRVVSSTLLSDPNFSSLLTQSIPSADPNASPDSTTLPASNGYYIPPGFWDAPILTGTASGGFAGAPASALPDWIYVTATGMGGTALQSGSGTVGRFAYHVYNIGGLLNANLAGYPSAYLNSGGQLGLLEGTAAGADLTQLGVPQSAMDALVAFRNPQVTGANYADIVAALASEGFLSATATDSAGVTYTNNFFPTRQSLLAYAAQNNPGIRSALPYLTTFSLSSNAPSWKPPASLSGSSTGALTTSGPATPVNKDVSSVRYAGSTSATFTHYDDNGNASTYAVNPGAPLIQRRFSLAKLPWITHVGPATINGTPISAAAIQACFGLSWNPTATMGVSGSATFTSPRWEYTALSTGTSPGRILRLDEVAALTGTAAREPNFFELLKAGLLWGSLGRDPGPQHGNLIANSGVTQIDQDTYYLNGIQTDEAVLGSGFGMPQSTGTAGGWSTYQDMQILQIGVNLIDQTTSGNCPNAIFGGTGTNTIISSAGITDLTALAQLQTLQTVYGIKDLPYLNGMVSFNSYVNPQKALGAWLVPSVWDPMAPTISGTDTPGNLRLNTYGDAYFVWNYWYDSISGTGASNTIKIVTHSGTALYSGTLYGPTTCDPSGLAGSTGAWFTGTAGIVPIYSGSPAPGPWGNAMWGYCYHTAPAGVASNLSWPPIYTAFNGNGTSAGSTRTDGILPFPYQIVNSSGNNGQPGARTQPVMLDTVNAPGNAALRVQNEGTLNSAPTRYNFATSNQLSSNPDTGVPVGVYIPGDTNDTSPVVYSDQHFGPAGTYLGSVYQVSGSAPPNPFTGPLYSGTIIGLRTTGGIWGGAQAYSPYAQNATMTFTLEYKDPADGTWRPYSHITKAQIASTPDMLNSNVSSLSTFATPRYTGNQGAAEEIHIDPRTDRFSTCQAGLSFPGGNFWDLSHSMRPNLTGTYTVMYWPASALSGSCGNPGGFYYNYLQPPGTSALLYSNNIISDFFRNLPTLSSTNNAYYSDPDGIVRPADGALANLSTGDGCPIYSGTNSHPTVSRPVVLDRPFRSVAEMGYAFRDTPFASLDFAPPNCPADSADTALLDLFCVNDNSVVAGNVNPNTAPVPVVQSLLSQAPEDDAVGATDSISGAEAASIAANLVNSLSGTGAALTAGDLAYPLSQAIQNIGSTLEVANKTCREAPIRALASSADTRTWNLLIDLVAQSGSMPAAASASNFVVQGESRYWLQLAIDRYTGQVLGQTLEQVPTGPVAINFSATSGSTIQLTDNQPIGSALATLAAADSGSNNTLTYSLVSGSGGNDNADFTISGNSLQSTGVLQYLTQSTYNILVQATDQNGQSFQQALTVNLTPGSYTQWKIANFSTNAANPAIAGDTVSPAGDNIPNLVKYALGLNPLQPSTIGISATANAGLMTLNYSRADAATDVTVHAYWSNDLHNWTTTGITESMLSDNGAIQLWQATVPMNSQAPAQFMRLQITNP